MIWMDLTKATPNDRAGCFGEAFRHIDMIHFTVTQSGVMHTLVMLDQRTVKLVGDPEKALAVYRGQGTAWAVRRLATAFWDGLTGALLVPVAIWKSARATWVQSKGRKTP